MIVGCYTLDLYCRFDKVSHGRDAGRIDHGLDNSLAQFEGATYAECKRASRNVGWSWSRQDVTCPSCRRKGLR